VFPWKNLEHKIDEIDRKIEDHSAADDRRFGENTAAIVRHEENVERRHVENQSEQGKITAALNELKGAYNVFADMLPAIRAGIAEYKDREYKKKLRKRIALSVVGTLTFVAAMVPLLEAVSNLRLSLHWAGH
jgi:hypothetical protein